MFCLTVAIQNIPRLLPRGGWSTDADLQSPISPTAAIRIVDAAAVGTLDRSWADGFEAQVRADLQNISIRCSKSGRRLSSVDQEQVCARETDSYLVALGRELLGRLDKFDLAFVTTAGSLYFAGRQFGSFRIKQHHEKEDGVPDHEKTGLVTQRYTLEHRQDFICFLAPDQKAKYIEARGNPNEASIAILNGHRFVAVDPVHGALPFEFRRIPLRLYETRPAAGIRFVFENGCAGVVCDNVHGAVDGELHLGHEIEEFFKR